MITTDKPSIDDKCLVVGETYPHYSCHLRKLGDTPVNLGGHVPKPLSLCGRPIAWDTQIPVAAFDDCASCVAARGTRFVILDDSSDMAMHKNRLVQTDCEEGLLDEHVELAIRVMSWDGRMISSPMGAEDAEE